MHRPLNLPFLLSNQFLTLSSHDITDHHKMTPKKKDYCFIGQLNKEDKPDGVVREITLYGGIFEG